jgi:cation diffusion facilitator family transporter
MHNNQIELWQHQHTFNVEKRAAEKRTLIVVIVTFVTMFAEIIFGLISNSMALLADGWHMGTHAFALGISLLAYIMARRHATNQIFTFGTWKIEILGAYTSAVVLGIVGLIMVFTSIKRILNPLDIHYNQALFVAVLGLVVNLISAAILDLGNNPHEHKKEHHHGGHGHSEHHKHKKTGDLNLKSAYMHVLADALTSVLAIVALLGAKYFHFNWLDPIMGIVGAGLILSWAMTLYKETAVILLDSEMDSPLVQEIKNEVEADGDTKVSDLHLWRVAQSKYACIVSVVTADNFPLEDYKNRLNKIPELAHVTIEINKCKKSV